MSFIFYVFIDLLKYFATFLFWSKPLGQSLPYNNPVFKSHFLLPLTSPPPNISPKPFYLTKSFNLY
jgi:hypothetical protein